MDSRCTMPATLAAAVTFWLHSAEFSRPNPRLTTQNGRRTTHQPVVLVKERPQLRAAPALVLNRWSRVMPGLRGTPAGMTTRSAPYSAPLRSSAPVCAVTCSAWRAGRHPDAVVRPQSSDGCGGVKVMQCLHRPGAAVSLWVMT
jgi:hypothetical protein